MTRRRPDIAVEPLLSSDARSDVRVITTGHLPFKKNWVNHRFSGFAVGFVARGAGQYRMSKAPERAILPGTLFCVHRGPVFHYGPQPGSTWEEYYLVVHGPGLRRWLKQGWLWTDGTVRQVQDSAAMAARFQELRLLLARGGPGDRDRAVSVAERVLLEGYFGQSDQPSPDPHAVLSTVAEYCKSHLSEEVDFKRLARSLGVSYSLLRREMKLQTGLAPYQYLTRIRCDRARDLLAAAKLPVKAVGAEVGIPDAFTFSRTFKRCTGVAPQHYRDSLALTGTANNR